MSQLKSSVAPLASVIINDMDRSAETEYGYRSWLLQDSDQRFEVILNLFNRSEPGFKALEQGANPNAVALTRIYDRPATFNISAANNLGLHVASGEYVIFANSDIIYPPCFLRRVMGEMNARGLSYINGARINLSASQSRALAPAKTYTRQKGFEFLYGYENIPGRSMIMGLSPWIVRRDVALAVGGFDPAILCHEDSEFNDRVMHYLRRTGQQRCLFALADSFGYHVDHPPSDLYGVSRASKEILEPRRSRLAADPDSTEDVVSNQIDDINSLLLAVARTPEIVPKRTPWGVKIRAKLRRAVKRLFGMSGR